MVRMPTPEAVLAATRLLAAGSGRRPGAGDVVVVDVGGATTDVHSSRVGEVVTPGLEQPLLPTPTTLRTVEGDLGLRAGAAGVLDADRPRLAEELGEDRAAGLDAAVARRGREPEWIPSGGAEAELDGLLATACVGHALGRHCGKLLLTTRRDGSPSLSVDGPDLREARELIGTGGVFAHRGDGRRILARALERRDPQSLAPVEPTIKVDADYVLAAAGLLAEVDPELALELLDRELRKN
jgi:uncharacterized protein (TIGR01319 family)